MYGTAHEGLWLVGCVGLGMFNWPALNVHPFDAVMYDSFWLACGGMDNACRLGGSMGCTMRTRSTDETVDNFSVRFRRVLNRSAGRCAQADTSDGIV